MALLAPGALLFAALLLPVVVMYFIRQRREAVVLPSIALWTRFVKEPANARRLERFRNSPLLWLQLLLMLALIFALARPFLGAPAHAGAAAVLILDASASMAALEDGESRFDRARAEASEFIDGATGRVMLVAAGPRPWVVHAMTDDAAALHRALDDLRPTGGSGDVADALRVAAQAAGTREPPVIHVWTDGAGVALAHAQDVPLTVQWHRVGKTADNVGVTALAVRRRPDSPLDLEVFASVANFSGERRDVAVNVYLDQVLLHYSRRTLAPGGVELITEPLLAGRTGVVRVQVEAKDALAVDNSAALVLSGRDTTRVMLVTRGNPFLRRALDLLPAVDVLTAHPRQLPENYADVDLVVFDEWVPLRWPRQPALLLGPKRGPLLRDAFELASPEVALWRRNHPLLRHLTFADVHVAQAIVQPWAEGVTPLVSTDRGALIWSQTRDGARQIVVGFPLSASDWIFRPSFPMFLANVLDSVREDTRASATQARRVGEALRVPLPAGTSAASVEYPDGHSEKVQAPDGSVTIDDTREAGVYTVAAGSWAERRAVNVLDADESNIAPGTLPDSDAPAVQRAGVGLSRELWPWLLGLAVLVSLLEWTLYHRRTLT